MIPTQTESFPLPSYEDRLWAELEQLHAEEAGGQRPGRPHQRRRYLAVVGGLAAAASITVLLLVVDDDGRTNTAEEGGVPVEDTAPRNELAVDPAATQAAIVVNEFRGPDGLRRTWTDQETGSSHGVQLEADGSMGWEDGVVFATHPDGTRTSQQTAIDHVTREYQVYPPSPLEDEFAPGWEAQEILEAVENGDYVLDGTDMIDGVEVRRYVATGMANPPPGISLDQLEEFNRQAGARTVWIDPVAGRLVKDQIVGSTYDYTQTYTYLPRTPENLALLDFHIPEGYLQVDELSRGVG